MKKYADGGDVMDDINFLGKRAPEAGMAPRKPAPRKPAPRRRPMLPPEAGAGDVTPPPGAPGMPTGMKSGGSVSKRADGIAQRGKTNCKMY